MTVTQVREAFVGQAANAFAFLVGEFGMFGPKRQGVAAPVVAFDGYGIRYRVALDADRGAVMTRVETVLGDRWLGAGLPELVEAAGVGAREHIATSAATVSDLLHSLDSQSAYTRRLHRRLVSGDLVELMRAAGAQEGPVPWMDVGEFDALVRAAYEQVQRTIPADIADELAPVVAVPEEIAGAERALGVVLPDSYQAFMLTHGASFFLGEETIPVRGLVEFQRGIDFGGPFVAVVTLGTGDYLGFVHRDGFCEEPVYLWDHDEAGLRQVAPNFREWAADLARKRLAGDL
jgi:hypothetical protein